MQEDLMNMFLADPRQICRAVCEVVGLKGGEDE